MANTYRNPMTGGTDTSRLWPACFLRRKPRPEGDTGVCLAELTAGVPGVVFVVTML
jgi:hypothetical protein